MKGFKKGRLIQPRSMDGALATRYLEKKWPTRKQKRDFR